MRERKKKPSYSVLQNVGYLLKKWWGWSRRDLLLAFLRVPALVLVPFLGILLPKAVIDCLTGDAGPGALAALLGGFTLALCLFHGMDKLLGGMLSAISMRNRMNLTVDFIDKGLRMDYQNIEDPANSKRFSKAQRFIYSDNSGGGIIVETTVKLLASILGLLLYGGMLVALTPLAAVILLVLSGLVLLAERGMQRYEFRTRDERAKLDRQIQYLFESSGDLAAGKDIRLYRIGRWMEAIFYRLLSGIVRWNKRLQWRWFGVDGFAGIAAFLRDGLAYGYLIAGVLAGNMTVADFTLYFGAVAGFASWIGEIFRYLSELNRISLECCDYREYIELPDRFPSPEGAAAPLPKGPVEIVFDHVSFRYPGATKDTLHDVSFTARPGERLALVGRNGAGKTTCVKLLCGFYQPTAGRILVGGVDASRFTREDYFDLFTAVFQDLHILPFSVETNVAASGEIDRERVRRCLALAGMLENVERRPGGLEALMDKTINLEATEFSGGELQRVMLARALYKESPALILDEPTAALDPIAENELYQKYSELSAGRTSFFISHRLSSTRFCDRILYLEDGEIREEGTHARLMEKNGRYAWMYGIQSHYYQKELKENAGGGGDDEAIA